MNALFTPEGQGEHIPVIELDMDAIYSQAKDARAWQMFYAWDGQDFRWSGKAVSEAAADLKARAELSSHSHEFNRYKAHLVAAVGD
jgi:hypothetical protein